MLLLEVYYVSVFYLFFMRLKEVFHVRISPPYIQIQINQILLILTLTFTFSFGVTDIVFKYFLNVRQIEFVLLKI